MKQTIKLAMLSALGGISLAASAAITDGKSYGDWTGTCQDNVCGVVQLQNNANGEPIGRILLRKMPEAQNAVVAFITLPLGINLRAGLALAVDNKELGVAPFDFCDPGGCNAAIPLDNETLGKIRAGNQMQVAAFVGEEQQTIQFSLKGVTNATNNL